MSSDFDPSSVDLDTADPRDIICYLSAGGNDYDGRLGTRISALFVILIVSTAATVFPVAATHVRSKWFRIPLHLYLFARYFGAGVIIATAFIHLLDPAYGEIGPQTCVGMTGNWASYTWPPAIAMTSVMVIFLLDVAAEWYVEEKYGFAHDNHVGGHGGCGMDISATLEGRGDSGDEGGRQMPTTSDASDVEDGQSGGGGGGGRRRRQQQTAANENGVTTTDDNFSANKPAGPAAAAAAAALEKKKLGSSSYYDELEVLSGSSLATERAFKQQIAAFLVLEFGVIFHSVIIGLNLGVVGDEFATLYPVVVFHQAFEGLGIGARLSVIPFPSRLRPMPWLLCLAYGLTTPIAIAIGLGLSTRYDAGSFTASVVSGVFDSISAGILLYTGLVELLARDFLFNTNRTRDRKRVVFNLSCLLLGAALMALLGKWA